VQNKLLTCMKASVSIFTGLRIGDGENEYSIFTLEKSTISHV